MSEDFTNSPSNSEKMDETSDQSTPDFEINVLQEKLDNENKQTSSQTNKTISKSIVTNSHPLMYSPDSDNFNPAAHSSLSKSCESNLENSLTLDLELDLPNIEAYNEQLPEFPESPTVMKKSLMYEMPLEIQPGTDLSDTENEKSIYEAILSPNLQNVSLTMNEKYGNLNFLSQVKKSNKLRKIKVVAETQPDNSDVSSIDSVSDSIKSEDVYPDKQNIDIDMNLIRELLDSPDDLDDSVLDFTPKDGTPKGGTPKERTPHKEVDPIEEYTAEEERRDSRHWQKIVLPSGEQRSIDMRVIEPYKRVLSHGGYLKAGGHNAIIIFSACYLPDKSRKDYVYVMDNLFLYVLQTLDQLVTEDYVLIYLHGSASSHCIPTMGWLKRCYQLIDRRLRKNLKQLYLVHPTFWLKTIIMMTKPFISAKFYRKLHFVNSLQELTNRLPIEQAAIPERVINYDKLKFSTS